MILIVAAAFPPEPVVGATIACELAEYLGKSKKVVVLSPKPTRPFGFRFEKACCRFDHFEHIIVDSFTYPRSRIAGRFLEGLSFGSRVSEYITEHHAEIECCYISSWPIVSELLIIKTLVKYHIPSVRHIQDLYPESLMCRIPVNGQFFIKPIANADRYILNNSTTVVAISRNMKLRLMEKSHVSPEKIVLIENWKNSDPFTSYSNGRDNEWMKKVTPGSFIFMYLGNIGPVAGVELLINGYVSASIPESELIIAGCGPSLESCKKLAGASGCITIRFLEVPGGELVAAQSIADVMLLPVKPGASMSSVPSKLPAYMLSAKPVIASVDAGSDTAQAILESGCGWLLTPGDESALADAMRQAASASGEILKEMGRKGFDYAMKNYSAGRNLPLLAETVLRTAGKKTENHMTT